MDWKKFYTTDKAYKVSLIQDILAKEGIECREISKKDSAYLIGEIELYVMEDNVEKATELIENHDEL